MTYKLLRQLISGSCKSQDLPQGSSGPSYPQSGRKSPKQLGNLVAAIHFSPFTCCFRSLFGRSFTGFFSATRTPNPHNHSHVHYSLSKFTGEWFTSHSNHIHRFTPITRIVATKVRYEFPIFSAPEGPKPYRKRSEYCFERTASEKRTH